MRGPIHFRSACVKTLSAVEADPSRSNQHEFNGVIQLKDLFGEERTSIQASFSTRGNDEITQSEVTWYDARDAHPRRSEYRLYFQPNPVMENAREGDDIIIGFDNNGNLHCELIPRESAGHNGDIGEWRPFPLG